MKIRKIQFYNHSYFNNLEIDFTDKSGNSVDTIIIAGENGVGKSLLLNTIFELTRFQVSDIKRDEKRVFEIQFSEDEVELFKTSENIKAYFNTNFPNNIFRIRIDYNIISTHQILLDGKTENGFVELASIFSFILKKLRSIFKVIFSDVEINFTAKPIENVKSNNVDINNLNSERSSSDLATQITQLLVDVQSLDALDFSEWAKENIGQQIQFEKIDTRIRRFTTAFHFIFPKKKYKKIENRNNVKEVIFEEDGREMTINQLSSGEKQIVFRGSFLLKDKESSKGSLILIDEPEISLHPTWQLKIMDFFKKLFTNEKGNQTSQIFVTTHSPFIIHNANRLEDKVIILQQENGKTIIASDPKFYGWTSEKIVKEAFNIPFSVTINKTTVFLEGETDEKYFNTCLKIYEKQNLQIEFKWIGRINSQGNAENTGDSALNQAKTFFLANPEHIKSKIILLYDSDTKKPEETFENLFIKKMRTNSNNITYKIGVENLLTLTSEINTKQFYKQITKVDDYSAESIITQLDKTALCNFICDNLDINKQKLVLINLNEEIEQLMASPIG